MTLAATINAWLLFVGGPAVVVALSSVINSYNNWRTRRAIEDIRGLLQSEPVIRVVSPKEFFSELSAYGAEYRKEFRRLAGGVL